MDSRSTPCGGSHNTAIWRRLSTDQKPLPLIAAKPDLSGMALRPVPHGRYRGAITVLIIVKASRTTNVDSGSTLASEPYLKNPTSLL